MEDFTRELMEPIEIHWTIIYGFIYVLGTFLVGYFVYKMGAPKLLAVVTSVAYLIWVTKTVKDD